MAEINEKTVVDVPDPTKTDAIGKEKQESIIGETFGGGLMKNGIRIHPQPTSDPLDPLNWSTLQKFSIVAIVMVE